jgi:hypothetical protein
MWNQESRYTDGGCWFCWLCSNRCERGSGRFSGGVTLLHWVSWQDPSNRICQDASPSKCLAFYPVWRLDGLVDVRAVLASNILALLLS